jgi:hypothetical protein
MHKTYQVQGALGVCHDLYSVPDLAAKTIRNWGWSLDPSNSGDASLRPFDMLAILKHFLLMSFVRMGDNLRALRLRFVPIDLALMCCGLCLIFKCGLRQLQLRRAQ